MNTHTHTDPFGPVTETGKTGFDHVTALAERLIEHRNRKDALSIETKANNADILAIETAMCDAMMSNELGKFTFRDRTFYMSDRTHVSSKADRRDELIEWLDDNGHGDIAKRNVNAQSLGSLVRELREETGEIPGDIVDMVNVHVVPTISVRKG